MIPATFRGSASVRLYSFSSPAGRSGPRSLEHHSLDNIGMAEVAESVRHVSDRDITQPALCDVHSLVIEPAISKLDAQNILKPRADKFRCIQSHIIYSIIEGQLHYLQSSHR